MKKNEVNIDEINGIKNEISLSPFEIKMDLTESANKTLAKPAGAISTGIGTILDFFNNTVLFHLQKYNITAKFKLREYAEELERKLSEIPVDKLVDPKMNVIGPAFESLKYNFDEDDIKEMFTNLITKSVNIDYKEKVVPAFVEIIKQLSSDDAKYIKKIYEVSKDSVAIIKLTLKYDRGFHTFTNYAVINNEDYFFIDNFILDNLLRLQLVQIPNNIYLINTNYESIFNKIKEQPEVKVAPIPKNAILDYTKEKLEFTSLGKKFIDICLS